MKNNAKVFAGILFGVAVGAVLGVMFAPRKGSDTRKKMADATKDFGDKAKEKVNEGMKMASAFRSKVNGEAEDFSF